MTIVLNTLEDGTAAEQIGTLIPDAEAEVVSTRDMKIAHCMGMHPPVRRKDV